VVLGPEPGQPQAFGDANVQRPAFPAVQRFVGGDARTDTVQGLYNYQHFETVAGLQMYCTYRSLISSAILNRLNPHDYLEEVLRLVRHWPKERMLELAPKNWRGTVEKLDDRQRRIIKPPWKDKVPRSPLMRTG
jgi:hypothetical protein